ncbi:MAG: helix-turn-helix domain-containing protein [Cyclobacteriaceae bacterium]
MVLRLPSGIQSFGAHSVAHFDNICLAQFNNKDAKDATPTFLSEHAIIFLMQGEKIMYSGDQRITISSNNVILLKRGYYLMCERLAHNNPYHSLVFYFNETVLQDFWQKFYQAFENLKPSSARSVEVVELTEPFQVFKDALLYYLEYNGQHTEYIVKNRFEEFILLLLQRDPKHAFLQFISDISGTRGQQVNQVVNENIFNPITLDDLAKLSGLSLSAFKREFKEQYGESPKRWILQRRLEHARILLESSEKPVKEIAWQCGFESVAHFTRVFKQHYGTPPRTLSTQRVKQLT